MCSVTPYAKTAGVCDACGKKLPKKRRRWCSQKCALLYRRNHRWSDARAAARKRDKYRCVQCGAGREAKLEVNHVKPRLGKGYGFGCWHHLDGLQTVCHACHVVITRGQRAAVQKALKK